MKRKTILAVLCIAAPLFYFSYRLLRIQPDAKQIPASECRVSAGRYYLGGKKDQAFIEISEVSDDTKSFRATIHSYDFSDTADIMLLLNKDTVHIGDFKYDENGEIMTDEQGNEICYQTEAECKEANQKSRELWKNKIESFLQKDSFLFQYSAPSDQFENAAYYSPENEMENSDILAFPNDRTLVFDYYTWILE